MKLFWLCSAMFYLIGGIVASAHGVEHASLAATMGFFGSAILFKLTGARER